MINRIFMLIMVFSLCHAQVAISGGIQKEVDLHQSVMISDWDGLYGQVVLGVGANVSYNVTGGNISRLDLIAQEPPQCNGTPEVLMHIVAVNASSVVPPLQPGNIPVLDAAIPGHDNGSDSFINTSSFDLTYGNFTLVPALFTFAANNSPAFPEGYFNDAEGNLVFVADVVSDQPDWNGSISDYQLMLPKNGTGYSIFADAIYSCVSNNNPPGPTHKFHRLYIAPPPQQPIQIIAGTPSDLVFSVQDIGNFPESAINGEIDPGQFPDPVGSIAKEHNGFGPGDPAPHRFGAQAGSELFGGDDIGDVSRRIIVAFGALVGLVRLAVCKNGSHLDLAGARPAVFALAATKLLAAHGAPVPSVPTKKISPAAGLKTGPWASRHWVMRGAICMTMRWI